MKYSSKIPADELERVIGEAFKKWEKRLPITFIKLAANPHVRAQLHFTVNFFDQNLYITSRPFSLFTQQPDIRVMFASLPSNTVSFTNIPNETDDVLDVQGADIVINDLTNWHDEEGVSKHKLFFTVFLRFCEF